MEETLRAKDLQGQAMRVGEAGMEFAHSWRNQQAQIQLW